tara:strand:+ start:472 stop:669 length:198 start_codon:yes stop_codon:yes gene_type:complete
VRKKMDLPLANNQIKLLREKGIITEKETAFKSGDLIVAEHVITGDRRIVDNASAALLESRGLLKG